MGEQQENWWDTVFDLSQFTQFACCNQDRSALLLPLLMHRVSSALSSCPHTRAYALSAVLKQQGRIETDDGAIVVQGPN
jgi:hypothetical protein